MRNFSSTITKELILKAAKEGSMRSLSGIYCTKDGRRFVGLPVSEIPGALRNAGWRNIRGGDFDAYNLQREYGIEVVPAAYVGGARPTNRYVDTVVIQDK